MKTFAEKFPAYMHPRTARALLAEAIFVNNQRRGERDLRAALAVISRISARAAIHTRGAL